MPGRYPEFPHHSQVKAYLDEYADVFGLREAIEFGNGVVRASRCDGRGAHGGWRILAQAGAERRFDLLVVANGRIVPNYIAGRPGDTFWRTTPSLPLS